MNAHRWDEIERVFGGAVELPEAEQQEFLRRECGERPELIAELQSLLAAHHQGRGFLEARPDRVGPYRLLEEIGHGGMGRVYRGERADGQFEQQVAVKLLSTSGGPVLAQRFAAERQILANLSHPNIASLLDGGVTKFGVAYIAMELVEGVPVDRYCRTVPLAERVRLSRRICDAVHYAHQNLVVHRDLKPANILVTASGSPKLLDFGIAKMLSAEDRTRTLIPSMTPDYASPEQIAGSAVTTASDVYSLGVLLRELLTGHAPGSSDAALPTGSRDLDAIVARATRVDPGDRYASAEALSADLARFLEHRPVEARRGALWYVVSKFAARNRVAVGVSCAAALAVGVAMGVTVRQSRIAHRRFEDVRSLASSTLFEIHNAVAALPGSTTARKLIVTNALDALDRLSRDVSGDPALQLELAAGYLRLGDVQGLVSEANLGDSEGARASYEKARVLLGEVLRREPSNLAAMQAMVKANRARAVVLLSLRRQDEARTAAAESVRYGEELRRREPGGGADSLLSSAYLTMADASSGEEETSYRDKALEICERLLAASPNDAARRRSVAIIHKTIAGPLVRIQYGEQALPHLGRAEELDTARLREAPDNRQAKMDLSFDYSQNGTYYLNRNRYPEALDNYRKSLAIRQSLAASDPADARMTDRLAYIERIIGDTLLLMNQHREAGDAFRESLRYARLLAAKDPSHPGYLGNIAIAQAGMAASEMALGRTGTACAAWHGAFGIYRDLDGKGQLRESERDSMREGMQQFKGCSL